jgi:hypothetical protein
VQQFYLPAGVFLSRIRAVYNVGARTIVILIVNDPYERRLCVFHNRDGYYKIFCISRLALKNVAVYIGGSNSKVKDSEMEKVRDRFEANLGDTVMRWMKPRMDWEVADALAAPVYKYIEETIDFQKGRAVCGDIVEGEFAVSVCPYDTNTLDPLFETAPLLLSDLILKYVEIFETADEAFAAIAVSIENARKKVEMLDD